MSARNVVRRNNISGRSGSGVQLINAGTDNSISENVLRNNVMGIIVSGTKGAHIEGNIAYQNLSRTRPTKFLGFGIRLIKSTEVTLKNNSFFLSTGSDYYWDNYGTITFIDNPGLTSMSAVKLTNTTAAARNPAFQVGDGYLLEITGAPANNPVYLRLAKDFAPPAISGPYGTTDSQGRLSIRGTYDSSAVGQWYVQALFGSPGSTDLSGFIDMTVLKRAP